MAKEIFKKSLRGANLDDMLDRELALMLSDGFDVSPISIPALTARLNLSSRSTLHTSSRKERIIAAVAKQNSLRGTKLETIIRRKTQTEKIAKLEAKNQELLQQLDYQIELVCRIVANATAKGWDVEYLLHPLRKNGRELIRG